MTDLVSADRPTAPTDLPVDADLWLWLAGVFTAPPTRDGVAAYRRGPARIWLDRLAAEPDLAPGVARMIAVLDTPIDDDALTSRLGIAQGRLFLGIGGPDTVAPYESAHTGDGRLFQAPVAEMERLLAAHDLSVAADAHEPADHLAIELALMARLVATDHPDRAALAERLAAWIPAFCGHCVDRDGLGFWAGAALVLDAVVDRETRRKLGRTIKKIAG